MSKTSAPTSGLRLLVPALVLLLVGSPSGAELSEQYQAWNRWIEPFRIAGNLYYVGTNEIAAYLFASKEGHILLDGGFEETAPLIERSIRTLGFELTDVKILINSHAHLDHCGGLASLKEKSGGQLLASAGDAPLLEAGGDGDPEFAFPPVSVDRRVADGEEVTLGPNTVTANLTPGHTPGCTSWSTVIEEGEARFDVVFVCSVNALPQMDLLAADPAYPGGRAEAFRSSIERLQGMSCDIFLGCHGSFFLLGKKRAAMERGEDHPFVDRELYLRHLSKKAEQLEAELDRQRAESGAVPSPE